MEKLEKLKKIIKRMDSVLLAYSGGADSTFLLKICQEVLGKRVLAVTADSLTYPRDELNFSKKITKGLDVRHKIIKTEELGDTDFVENPANRCYFCKKELFSQLTKIAKVNKINYVIDATNLSDKLDFRPGNKAKEELGVRSPLKEAGITKLDIRSLSRKLGLVTWDKPSLACLASRIPYGLKITPEILKCINRAELYLKRAGFKQARVRHYNGLCRIEVSKDDIPKLTSKGNKIVDRFKKIGYNYITIDLEGYRTGSMNETLKEKNI